MVSSALIVPGLRAMGWLAVPVFVSVQAALPLVSAAVSPHGDVRHGARTGAASQRLALVPLPADEAPGDSDGLNGFSLLRREAQEDVTAANDAGLGFQRLVDSQVPANGSGNGSAASAPSTTVTTTLSITVTATATKTVTTSVTSTQTTTKTATVTTTQSPNVTSGFLIIGCARAAAFAADELVAEAVKTAVSLMNNVFMKDVNVSLKCMRECHGKDAVPANNDAPALLAASTPYTGPLAAPAHALFQLAEHWARAAAQGAATGTDEQDVAAAVKGKRGVVSVEYGIQGQLPEDFVQAASSAELTTKLNGQLAERGSAEKAKYGVKVLGKTRNQDEVKGLVSVMVAENNGSYRSHSSLVLPLLLGFLVGWAA